MPRKLRKKLIFNYLLILALCISIGGCAWPFQRGPVFDDVNLGDFPIDRAQLLALSFHAFNPDGPAQEVARSLIAAQNVMLRDPDNMLASYFASRAALWLIEFGGSDINRSKLADEGYAWAEKLIRLDPDNGEFYFLAGAHLGFKVQTSIAPRLITLRTVHELFEKAAQMAPRHDEGGPLRALGTLLIKSPPWPTGVGDIDEGIKVLEKSVAMFPYHPANHLYLGEAYIEDERFEDAEKAFQRTLELTEEGAYGVPGKTWRTEAKAQIKSLQKHHH